MCNTDLPIDSLPEAFDNHKFESVKNGLKMKKENIPAKKFPNDYAEIQKFDKPFFYTGGNIIVQIDYDRQTVLPMFLDAIISKNELSEYYKAYIDDPINEKWKEYYIPYMQFETEK